LQLVNSAASSVGRAIQALKTGPAQLLDPSLSSSSSSASISLPGATVATAAGDSADHGRLAPNSAVIDSFREQLSNITDSLTGAGKAAGNILEETKASISDTVMAAQDSVTRGFTNVQEITRDSGDSVTRSFRNVQEIRRDLRDSNVGGNGVKDVYEGFAGAGKAAANMLEEAKASITDTVMAVQDSVTRSFRNVPEITGDSGNSTVGNNGVKDVYGGFAGAGEAAANILEDTKASIMNTVMAVQDTVTGSFTNVQDITTDSGDSVGNSVKDVYRGFAGAGKVAANILEETKASITDTVTAAQDSATRSFTNVQEITRDLGNSVGNGVKDVYENFAGAGKEAVNILEETNASITDTATAVQDSVTMSFTNVQEITRDLGNSVGNGVKDVYEDFAGAGKAAGNILEETNASITDTATVVQDSVTRSFTNVQEITRDSVDSVGSAVKDVYEGFNGNVMDAIDRVTGFYDKTVGDVQSTLDNTVTKAEGSVADFTGTFQMGTTMNDALRDAVVTVHSATGSALEASASAVADFYGSTKILLPTEAQSVLSIVEQKIHDLSAPVGNALQQVFHMILCFLLFLVVFKMLLPGACPGLFACQFFLGLILFSALCN
jgi:cytochrome c551/c552